MLRFCVGFVLRPEKRNQDVDVGQTDHQPSASKLFTCSDVTCGASSGRSNTTRPFTLRVFGGASNPRRTSSDTAFPKAIERVSAYFFTRWKISSSMARVVRINT